jgi:hypothetical protein
MLIGAVLSGMGPWRSHRAGYRRPKPSNRHMNGEDERHHLADIVLNLAT